MFYQVNVGYSWCLVKLFFVVQCRRGVSSSSSSLCCSSWYSSPTSSENCYLRSVTRVKTPRRAWKGQWMSRAFRCSALWHRRYVIDGVSLSQTQHGRHVILPNSRNAVRVSLLWNKWPLRHAILVVHWARKYVQQRDNKITEMDTAWCDTKCLNDSTSF